MLDGDRFFPETTAKIPDEREWEEHLEGADPADLVTRDPLQTKLGPKNAKRVLHLQRIGVEREVLELLGEEAEEGENGPESQQVDSQAPSPISFQRLEEIAQDEAFYFYTEALLEGMKEGEASTLSADVYSEVLLSPDLVATSTRNTLRKILEEELEIPLRYRLAKESFEEEEEEEAQSFFQDNLAPRRKKQRWVN